MKYMMQVRLILNGCHKEQLDFQHLWPASKHGWMKHSLTPTEDIFPYGRYTGICCQEPKVNEGTKQMQINISGLLLA